ncbi:dynein regulatory complex protein 1 isoform X2 [Echeneis naucrates]|nr:dynein regulatory complex protein 1 isoform X2 [Echeneis naucrates]
MSQNIFYRRVVNVGPNSTFKNASVTLISKTLKRTDRLRTSGRCTRWHLNATLPSFHSNVSHNKPAQRRQISEIFITTFNSFCVTFSVSIFSKIRIENNPNMEKAEKDPEEAPRPPELPEDKRAKDGVFTQEAGEKSGELTEDVWESLPQQISLQRITNLQRDLTMFVTNIQTAADARESARRKEVEEAHRIRMERVESHEKSSQEKFEEITRGWMIVKEKATLQELREAQSSQQEQCALLLEDKRKFINDLQQELKCGDDRYVKDLRKEAEELNVMIERMDDHMKTLKKAYREEMSQIKRVYHEQGEVILKRDVAEWEQLLKKLWDKEQQSLEQRRKKVEEYEEKFNQVIIDAIDIENMEQLESNTKLQVRQREYQRLKGTNLIMKIIGSRQTDEQEHAKISLTLMRSRASSLQLELQNLQSQYASHVKWIRDTRQCLSKQIKSSIKQYECTQKTVKPIAVASARKFEEMWLAVEAEVKQLVERALLTDSLICEQYLGIAWERPQMAFMELSGPIHPQKQGPETESKLLTAGRGESDVKAEDKKPSMATLKKVMELLCEEGSFLMEDRVLKLLAPLEKEEQIVVKMGFLLCAFGVEEEDVPKLANFFMNYKEQHQEQTEVGRGREEEHSGQDVCGELGESSDQAETSDLIHPNHVLPALKAFLEQQIRENSNSGPQVEARDSSEDEAYWERLGSIISDDRIKVWEVAENRLNQYL